MTKLDEIIEKVTKEYNIYIPSVEKGIVREIALEFAKHILEEAASEYQRVVTFESDSEEYVKQSITDTLNKYL